MPVFDAALARIFANTSMAVDALWVSATTSEEKSIRGIRRAPDLITEFGHARILSDTMIFDVQVGDIPEPRPDDLIIIEAESFVIQGEPKRDRERLVWTLDLRPA